MTAWLKKLFRANPARTSTRKAAGVSAAPAVAELSSDEMRRRGNRFLDQGNVPVALSCYQQAVALDGDSADAQTSLGFALQQSGEPGLARGALERALQLRPDSFDASYMLGQVYVSLDDPQQAATYFQQALDIQPGFEPLYGELCQTLLQTDALDQASAAMSSGLKRFPQSATLHFFQGNLHLHAQAWAEAIACYDVALRLNPAMSGDAAANLATAHQCLGYSCLQAENYGLAEQHSRKALALNPSDANARNNLGNALAARGRLTDAETQLRAAASTSPGSAAFHSNLGGALVLQGRLTEAIASLRHAVELDGGATPNGFSNLLFALNYHPDMAAEEIYQDYRAFEQRFGAPYRSEWAAHLNDRHLRRRLKVGYVSPDFKNHAARFFLEPLLAEHDRGMVEVYAYAELAQEDAVTSRYRGHADHWIPTHGLSDTALTQRIRDDGIDILVDLAGHTAGNRLGVFARKPAPVSISWMGYGYTTGLQAIDYYLTDAASAPEGSESLFSETLWRLPGCYTAYRPDVAMGEINGLPALERGHVTLGTLTRGVRINHRTVRVWAGILQRLPTAHLIIDSRSFQDPAVQARAVADFVAYGIARERLHIGFHSPPWDVLRGIDIGLDCFPHNSGTTLFETLYLGVPYVTLADRPSVGRIGSAILQGLGRPEWIARTEEEYADKVVILASDPTALAGLRATLRQQMQKSTLMDEAGFARQVEEAYTEMFARWAAKNSSGTVSSP